MKTLERRIVPLDRLELRTDNGQRLLSGHAAVFNAMSEEMYGFREQIAPGTFATTIKEDDVRALFNHNPDYVLGRRNKRSKTLRMVEDDVGLSFDVDLPDTQVARDLAVSIERGDITGCSFSFSTRKDAWQYNKDGTVLRTLQDVVLYDVGPVTFPAYPETDVAVRSLMQQIADEGQKRASASAPRDPLLGLRMERRRLDLIAKL